MTDIVERLREYVESTDYINAEPLCAEAADRIAELERELAACKAERDEDAEALFKAIASASSAQARENVLRDALETLYVDRHGNQFRDESDCEKALAMPADDTALNNLLAEGQAREKVLRDALHAVSLCEFNSMSSRQEMGRLSRCALAQPADDTALKAALKAERERCINCYSPDFTATDWMDAIRALGDE